MNVQRVGVRALQQAARPNAFAQNLPRFMLATMQTRRPASTTKLTESEAQSVLASQRRARPVSPHLQIYDYSQTWFSSSVWTRITGAMFTGGLYGYSLSYLVAPLFGWHIESASLAAAAASMPAAAAGGLKFLLAWPFMFHLYNGTRHLVFDLGKGYSKPVIKKGGWAIWISSLVSAVGIAAFL
ncbi:succinate dehydrogenase cytochrome b subunit [Xylariaceae sp. FL1272]|nr:succinate dehydrogenase cytochrome b subunit [Xylariaceae sp. FL1272]